MQSAKLSVPHRANPLVLLVSVTGKRLQKAAAKPSKSTPLSWSKPCNLIHAFVCAHMCVYKRVFNALIYISHTQFPKNFMVATIGIFFYVEITTDCIVTLLNRSHHYLSGIYTKAELNLSLKLLCYETADNTQPMGGGPSLSVLLHRIMVMTKERNNGDFGFHCRDCLMCLTCPFCSSIRVPRSLVSSVSKVASRKRKGELKDRYNTLEQDT